MKRRVHASYSAYSVAEKKAESMKASHPMRLGLHLNISVFYKDIINDNETAIAYAQDAFDKAVK